MVCYQPPAIESVPIADAVNGLSQVDPDSSAVQAARALGVSFGDRPADQSPFAAVPTGSSAATAMTEIEPELGPPVPA